MSYIKSGYFLVFFLLMLSSCAMIQINGTADIYQKELYYNKNIIDSACVLYYYKFPESRICDSIIDYLIKTPEEINKIKYEYYKKNKTIKTDFQSFIRKQYIIFSEKYRYYYEIEVSEKENNSILHLQYITKNSYISSLFYRPDLSRYEKRLITNEFDSLIVPRIMILANEIINKPTP